MGFSPRFSISSTLMMVLTLFCISCIISITYVSLSETGNNLKSSFNREMNASEDLFSKSSIYIHRGLKLWDSSYNNLLKRDIRILLDEYEKSGRNPSLINLSQVREQIDPLYRDKIDLYLINSSGVIEYTTENDEYLLDFRKWPDFYARLIRILQGDEFVPDEIVKGFQPGMPLRKFVYQPTSDHRYIAQISYDVQNESIYERAALSYGDLVSYVLNQTPELKDLHVISSMHTLVIGKKAYNGGKLDSVSNNITSQIFESHERVVITDPVNQTVTTYVYVPNAEGDSPSGEYMNLVAKFIYSSSDLNRQLTYNLMLHLVLAISASIIAILIAALISNRLTTPINQLVREIGLIAEGHYDQEISPSRHPELGRIADAVRSMVNQISRVIHELKESEEKYHDLFITASDAILILNGDMIIDANPAALNLFSKGGTPIVGKLLSSLCPPAFEFMMNPSQFRSLSLVSSYFSNEMKKGPDICEADINAGSKEGEGKILNIRIVPLNQGDTPLIQMQIRDITQRVEMEQKLHSMNIDLEKQVKERTAILEATITDLDSFTYSVSHDLRAPLRAIDGNAHFLHEKINDILTDDVKYHISKIHENIKKMDNLIDDLLKFSRMSRKPIEKETINMNTLVREVSSEISSQIHDSRSHIDIHDLPPAHGDPGLIRQVLINIISNAIKFGKKESPNTITISAQTDDDRVWYKIQDTGIGFNMRYAEKIFEVFLQLNPHDTYEGTGVGLAIVKRIIYRHGGRIRVQSEEGVGSTFYFSLD